MDIFDGLHPQCEDCIDVDDSDTSEDSNMEMIEQLSEPHDDDNLTSLVVDVGESEGCGSQFESTGTISKTDRARCSKERGAH